MLWLSTVAGFLIYILSANVAAEPDCIPVLLGSPKYSDCRKLLFGDGDPNSAGAFGIAAIDGFRHAFAIPRAERDHESAEEWAPGCKIALLPKLLPIFDEVGQYSRDTGDWLSIAEKAQYVNEFCVQEKGMGGLTEVGYNRRLLVLLYEPFSQQDREIEQERRETGTATMRSIGIDFSAAWGNAAWRQSGISDSDSEADWHDDFAEFLNIDEGERHTRARAGGAEASSASHVGAADPNVRNLGDGWELQYNYIQAFEAVNQPAAGLSHFYEAIIRFAAGQIGKGLPSSGSHGFHSDGLSFKLQSPDVIPWEWIITFARAMSQAARLGWPILYNVIAYSKYWNIPPIYAALLATY
ncbi:MAG: hypothetical protein Q9198_006605 [Flavoplaca austrocitrina]